jgi:hypothetical protein
MMYDVQVVDEYPNFSYLVRYSKDEQLTEALDMVVKKANELSQEGKSLLWIFISIDTHCKMNPLGMFGYIGISEHCNTLNGLVNPPFTNPAPSLTAELKQELLESLKLALPCTGNKFVRRSDTKEIIRVSEKVEAAITKLTNLECGS